MKKIIFGLGSVSLGGIASIMIWALVSAPFEMEGSTRALITSAVTVFSWIPIPVYLLHVLSVRLAYKNRVDSNSYQPLRRPIALIVNVTLQCIPMCLYWSIFRGNAATSGTGFLFALGEVCFCGIISMAAALVLGRPLPGKTRFPGFRADL